MKKILALIIALMFAFAVTSDVAAKVAKSASRAEEKNDAKKSRKGTVIGEVVAIDAKANTLTVKDPKKGNVALTVNDKTKIIAGRDKKTLTDIKAGDKVAVKYTEADNKNTADAVDIKAASAKAEEKKAPAPVADPKAEEKKPAAPAKKSAGY